MAVLGEAAAKPIVDKLDDQNLASIAKALESIKLLTRAELEGIVIEFLTDLRGKSGGLRGGKDAAREIIGRLVEPRRLRSVMGDADDEPENSEQNAIWRRVSQKEPKVVAAYLNKLSPNLIALILKRLDMDFCSEIITHLDDDFVGPVMGFMVEGSPVDPGIDTALARMLELEFLNIDHENSEQSGKQFEAIGELLSLIPGSKRERMIEFLKGRDASKLDAIQQSIFTVEDLPIIIDRASIPIIFRETDPAEMLSIMTCLHQHYNAVAEHLLQSISSRMAEQFREQLSDQAAISQERAEAVLRGFVNELMAMKRRGAIKMGKPGGNAG